jgi:adenylate cyclase
VPGLAGADHARVAIDAAREILRVTGHGVGSKPWAPVGVGVHTGIAFVGAVGSSDSVSTISALGDAVNTAARLASEAGSGEALASDEAARAAGLDLSRLPSRRLQLKGRSEAIDVRVLGA